MDKRLILAVAGSGKTAYILNDIDPNAWNIIVTYTNANIASIKKRLILRFGIIPQRTKVLTYFSFLYTFCYRPLLSPIQKCKGLSFRKPDFAVAKLGSRSYHMTKNGYVYHNRLALLLQHDKIHQKVLNRIDMFCEKLYIDEVQDFASHDFDFIVKLSKLKIPVLMVGDYYQHTFDTSRDGGKKRSLHDKYEDYKQLYLDREWNVDEETLVKSYRCPASICQFISKNLKINITHKNDKKGRIETVEDIRKAKDILNNDTVVKLFYENHHKHSMYSNNWGASKGEDDYLDVCIITTKAIHGALAKNNFDDISPRTLMKFYVACSRCNRNLYFMSSQVFKKCVPFIKH